MPSSVLRSQGSSLALFSKGSIQLNASVAWSAYVAVPPSAGCECCTAGFDVVPQAARSPARLTAGTRASSRRSGRRCRALSSADRARMARFYQPRARESAQGPAQSEEAVAPAARARAVGRFLSPGERSRVEDRLAATLLLSNGEPR